MCDYSLESRLTRPAVVGEKLVTTTFGSTSGFASPNDSAPTRNETVAVCLLPGTEIAFDAPVRVKGHHEATEDCGTNYIADYTVEHQVARFAKINPDEKFRHHDGLEFPDHVDVAPVLLTHLEPGQIATVIQMPVDEEAARREDEATRAPRAVELV